MKRETRNVNIYALVLFILLAIAATTLLLTVTEPVDRQPGLLTLSVDQTAKTDDIAVQVPSVSTGRAEVSGSTSQAAEFPNLSVDNVATGGRGSLSRQTEMLVSPSNSMDGTGTTPTGTRSETQRQMLNGPASNSVEMSDAAHAPTLTKLATPQSKGTPQPSFNEIDATATNKSEKSTDQSTQTRPPLNVVLFYADDWAYDTLGAMGNTYVKTPVLDQLAADGVLFTHNCVVTSVCMQSRATLYTGQYSSRHQTFFSWRDVKMYEEGRWNQTLYPLMVQQGYHVGFFGKYHHLEDFPPTTFSSYKSHKLDHYWTRGNVTKHCTQWNQDDAMEFLENRPTGKPFFLTVSFFATHAEDGNPEGYRPMESSKHMYENDPVLVPKTMTEEHWKALPPFFDESNIGRGRFKLRYNTSERYQDMMKKAYRMATEVDTACGNILALLKEQGVDKDTLVIFTTDNGNFHGQHGLAEKWYAYEESLRVPLIIKDPRIPAEMIGAKIDEFTLNIDLAPTILSAASVEPPKVMQGRDMAPLYLNYPTSAKWWRKEFLYEFWDDNANIPNSVALVRKGFKYIYWTDHNYTELFDLDVDPLEEHNIVRQTDAATLMRAQGRLDELRRSAKAGMPL
jgi:arylsulfatase